MRVERAFAVVDGREVHYRCVGQGPAALFIHSSPTNSSFVEDDMLALADRYTCFAFDTPGFGLSDPLPGDTLTVTDLAAATVAAIDALGLGPLPIFGTHTGAAIALELGYRYPDKVTGLVLDAVPIFTREEVAPLGDDYFAPLVVDVLGGHFSATWTRFRDQGIWFPWCHRTPGNLNDYDLLDAASLHRWTAMFFAAAPHYRAAYPAAIRYCEGAVEAAAGLTVPAVFTAASTDMLHSHLGRLPTLRDGQQIVEFGRDRAHLKRITREGFARFAPAAVPSGPVPGIGSATEVRRQFLADGDRNLMVRYCGDRTSPATLLLHDVPGSALMAIKRLHRLAETAFVIAPDLPGSGESEALPVDATLSDYADAMWRMCDALGLDVVTIEGHGLSASLAVEMALRAPHRTLGLTIDGLLLPDVAQRADLIAHYAPPIEIQRDGAHWYRTWLMLRDGLVYWPWYDTRRTALRRAPVEIDAQVLHDRTVETMKQFATWHHLIGAILRHDAAAALAACTGPVRRTHDPASALGAAYGAQLDTLLEREVLAV